MTLRIVPSWRPKKKINNKVEWEFSVFVLCCVCCVCLCVDKRQVNSAKGAGIFIQTYNKCIIFIYIRV